MKSTTTKIKYAVALFTVCAFTVGPALAQRQDTDRRQAAERRQDTNHRFDDKQRTVVQNYYREDAKARSGRCPPGLAKKQNGCMPPGQAKKWEMGKQLPRDVTYYTVPKAISQQLGVAPEGHKYVRIASDILMITQSAGVVVDAIFGQQGL
jgi:Ni/Co efflux regulator RcnB